MPLTETDIQNAALVQVGQAPLNSANQTSNAGTAVVAVYAIARDALLRESRWRFALAFAQLNQLSGAPLNLDIIPQNHGPGVVTYTGAYQLPNDCIRVSRFSPQESHWRIVGQQVYTDAVPPSSNVVILGTQPPNADGADNLPGGVANLGTPALVGIEYVRRVTDANQFDSLFTDCLTSKIAMELAFAVTGLESQQDRAGQKYKEKLAEAQAVNGIENWPDQLYDTVVEQVRFGYVASNLTDIVA